ncbi:uncharacterized protein LOC105846311 [Hydra vulgaris]|uniref:uncharacterized protein LOC105846311 n=1 Tax=Hydra vulgaris TaxID=6087 RepID=UPI001F5F5B9D|nr:uncharacterized protein LOC105846311 [Hydra vulgaris]
MFLSIFFYLSIIHSFFAEEFLFPLSQYMEGVNVTNTAQFLCQHQDSSLKLCNCHNDCFTSKTCCIDKLWNNSNPLPLDLYLETLVKTSNLHKDMACEQVIPVATHSGHVSEKILMVHYCHDGAESNAINTCLNNSDAQYVKNIPVIGLNNIIYRNAGCARCNFAQFFALNFLFECQLETNKEITFVKAFKMDDLGNDEDDFLNKYTNCNISLIRNKEINNHIFSCFSQDNCPRDNKYHDLCNAYSGVYLNYKNYDCFRCSLEKIIRPFINIELFNLNETKVGSSFISETVSIVNNLDSYPTCKTGLSYNYFTTKCEKIICCYGYTVVGSECLDLQKKLQIKKVENASFETCLTSEQLGLYVIIDNFKTMKTDFFSDEVSTNCSVVKHDNLKNLTLLQCNMSVTDSLANFIKDKERFTTFKPIGFTSIFIMSVYHQLYTDLYGIDFIRTFSNNKLCAQPEELDIAEGNFTSSCDYITSYKIIKNDDLIIWIEASKNTIKKRLITCKKYHLKSNCVLRPLTNNYIVRNKTLIYKFMNNEYNFTEDQFLPLVKGLGVCENSFSKYENLLNYVEDLLSVILISVSIVCYFIIVITYVYIKELRIMPNFNLVTLCNLLFLSDSSILIALYGSKKEKLCKCIAVILHWSLLAVYVWVLCTAVELASKFSRFASKSSRKIFFTSSVFISIIVPTIIVSVTLLLNYTGTADVGYGKNEHCWIGGFYARLYAYTLPLTVVLFLSFLCLLLTIFNIRKLESSNRKILGNSRKSRVDLFMITMKLTIILGVTDALVFIKISKDLLSEWEKIFNAVFSVIYTCCRSSKGVMLFFVYICTKKVYKIYKKRYFLKYSQYRHRVYEFNEQISLSVQTWLSTKK